MQVMSRVPPGAMSRRRRAEIENLLRSERIVRVAFFGEGSGYLLPLGYVWLDGALNLMTTTGRKTEMGASNPRVAFQVDDSASSGLLAWSSATGEGRWEAVTDPAAQERIAAALLERFPELREWAGRELTEKRASEALLFVRIRPLWMTGRRFAFDPPLL